MKIWIDDIRPAPEDYIWLCAVNTAKTVIQSCIACNTPIEVIDIDHDAGDWSGSEFGGDYINLLNWLEEMNYSFPIHIHSMNPVGVQNMRAIIQRNGWKEI